MVRRKPSGTQPGDKSVVAPSTHKDECLHQIVPCDRSTMTMADVLAGRLKVLVVAVTKPAEFLILQIEQQAGE